MLKEILKVYELNLGQCVNFEKSTVFSSLNTSEVIRAQISSNLGVCLLRNSKKYICLPNMVRRKRRAFF